MPEISEGILSFVFSDFFVSFTLSMLTLNLALITHGADGLRRVEEMNLPHVENVRYVVSWQMHENNEVPASLAARSDIEIHRLDTPGLSLNRNNAIDHCSADIILFADNDVVYSAEGLKNVIASFEADNSLDMALFKASYPEEKPYPDTDTTLSLPFPKGYYVSSIEIAFRPERIKDLRCCPALGLGASEMTAGEDDFFVISAIRRGLNVGFVNKEICSHPQDSTGDRVDAGIMMASGFIIRTIYSHSFFPRLFLKALRIKRAGKASFLPTLFSLWKGAAKTNRLLPKIESKYRW